MNPTDDPHVIPLLSARRQNELPAAERRRVAEHLLRCTACSAEARRIDAVIAALDTLPPFEARESLWAGIDAALPAPARALHPAAVDRSVTHRPMPLARAAAWFVLIAAAGFAAMRLGGGLDRSRGWNVVALQGAPRIGAGTPVGGTHGDGALRVGEWLVTDGASRAELTVADIGRVTLESGTRVRLVRTGAFAHELEMPQGTIHAVISAPPRLFLVETPAATAVDLGCAYTLSVGADGRGLLTVDLGYVALQDKEGEVVVPAGAACASRPGRGAGTPYFVDSAPSFQAALQALEADQSVAPALQALLDGARPRDGLTLWHLLKRLPREAREPLFDRLARLVPPPAGVTREAVLALDRVALERWYDALL